MSNTDGPIARSAAISNHDRFYRAQGIVLFGQQFSILAVPLTSAVFLRATPRQVSWVSGAEYGAMILTGLLSGMLVDRHASKPILVASCILRFLLLATVPLTAWRHVLTIPLLIFVAAGIGFNTVLYQAASYSVQMSLVSRAELLDSNDRLGANEGHARLFGPLLATAALVIFPAPMIIAVDSATFLIAAVILAGLTVNEPMRPTAIGRDLVELLRLVGKNALFRAAVGSSVTFIFFSTMLNLSLLLYVTRDLGLQPAWWGLVTTIGIGTGLKVGRQLNRGVQHRLGVGLTIIVGLLVAVCRGLLIAAMGGAVLAVVITLIVALFLYGTGAMLFNIGERSLRQSLTPQRLQGQAGALIAILYDGIPPFSGTLLAGILGSAIGVHVTLILAGCGGLLSVPWALFSPLRALRDLPSGEGQDS